MGTSWAGERRGWVPSGAQALRKVCALKIADFLRRQLIRLSRGVVLTRRLPRELGGAALRVSPEASLTYWYGFRTRTFRDLFDFAARHVSPGDHVWDVGANMGVFSFAAAHRCGPAGRVLGFEPDWWSCQLLQRSRQRNPVIGARLEVLPVAVSDASALLTLIVPERGRAATHLEVAGGAGNSITGGTRSRLLVPAVTLDWVAESQRSPNVIKIDVDGAEYRVLLGAQAILRSQRPRLLVEVYERNADAVGALLKDCGYRLFSYEQGEQDCQPIVRPSYNTLALPA